MSVTTRTLLNLYRDIAKEIGYSSGRATSGTASQLIDTSADSPMEADDDSDLFKNAWLLIEGANGTDAGASPVAPQGEIRRIRAYTPASQQLDTRNSFSATIGNTHDYGIYLGVPPERFGSVKGIKEYVNDVLRETYYHCPALLSLAADADMEASGVTSWTNTNASLAKATTKATGVRWGTQALQVTDSGSGNGYASQTFDVVPGQVFAVAVDAFGSTTGAGTQVKLNCYDVTQTTNITNASYTGTVDAGQIRTLAVQATIPAGCKLMRVELTVVTISGVGYFDNLSVRNLDAEEMDLPSWVEDATWVEEIQFHFPGAEVTSYGFQPEEGRIGRPLRFNVAEDRTGLTAYRVKLWPQPRYDAHVFAKAVRPYGNLANLASTTACNLDLIRARALALIYGDLGDEKKAARWAGIAQGLARGYDAMASKSQPLQMKEAF